MFCSQCGRPLTGTRFCTGCGAAVGGSPPDPGGPQPGDAPTAPHPAPAYEAPAPWDAAPPPAQGPPPYEAPPPWDRAPHDGAPRRPSVLVGVAVLVVLALLGAGAFLVLRPGRTPSARTALAPAAPTPTPSVTAEPTSPAPEPSATETPAPAPAAPSDAELQAAASEQLQAKRAQDLQTTRPAGQWVAQLASKYDGSSDPAQTTRAGSHVFRTTDILDEVQQLQRLAGGSVSIITLLTTDYGTKHVVNGHVYWVTFAEGGFVSRSDVQAWCTGSFPGRTGPALDNVCFPRQLDPPA